MAEPHTQGWKETLWPVERGGEGKMEAMSRDREIFVEWTQSTHPLYHSPTHIRLKLWKSWVQWSTLP